MKYTFQGSLTVGVDRMQQLDKHLIWESGIMKWQRVIENIGVKSSQI